MKYKICSLRPLINSHLSYAFNFYRRSRLQMFFKIGVLENFAKFEGKHSCWGLLFNKVACLQLYCKRDSNTGVFL